MKHPLRPTAAHDDHPHGLQFDLQALREQLRRRQMLRWMAAAGALPLVGCGGGGDSAASATSTTTLTGTGTTTTAGAGACSAVPEETAGPYPGDGSNGANALSLSGIVRSDIRSSFAGASATAAGVPLALTITLANSNSSSCGVLSGYAIYLWHCDRDGKYSLYSSGITGENYLRGVQATDSAGQVSFQTIFPGCYDGRVPHMHFEVYRSTTTATSYSNKLRTSQLAFPRDICSTIYTNASGYGSSLTNLNRTTFSSDLVFSDGTSLQMTNLSGSVAAGFTGNITVAIAT